MAEGMSNFPIEGCSLAPFPRQLFHWLAILVLVRLYFRFALLCSGLAVAEPWVRPAPGVAAVNVPSPLCRAYSVNQRLVGVRPVVLRDQVLAILRDTGRWQRGR